MPPKTPTSVNPAHAVYAEQLVYRGHGLPMWRPEPEDLPSLGDRNDLTNEELKDTEHREVMIGDVGFIWEGGFKKLFNVTLPESHPRNRLQGGERVPDGFEPLTFNRRIMDEKEKYFDPGPIRSKTVKSSDLEASVAGGAGPADVGVSYKFQCTTNQGAVLVLKDHATKKSVLSNKTFVNYMRQHHESWHAFAEKIELSLPKEDIILVRGFVKTTQWSVVSWTENAHAQEVALQAQGGNFAQASLKVSSSTAVGGGPESRSGPGNRKPHEMKPDQSVFLSYYKIKYRLFLAPKVIEAAAGPHQLPHEPGPSGETVVDVEIGPATRAFNDPLDDLLEYILRHSDAEVAIACDGDINDLFNGEEWPEDLGAYLREQLPRIDVDENKTGMLSLEAAIVRRHEAEVQAAEEAAAQAAAEAAAAAQAIAEAAEQQQQQEQQQQEEAEQLPEGDAPTDPDPAEAEAAMDVDAPVGDAEGDAEHAPSDTADEPADNEDSAPKVIPENLRGATIILGKDAGRAVEWPHHLLFDNTAEGGAVCSISISKDGRHIAAGFEDSVVRVWDLRTGTIVYRMTGHAETVWSVAFSPTENRLVSGSADQKAIIWNTTTGDAIGVLEGHEGDVWSIAYSPDGKSIATGSVDCTVKVWDAHTCSLRFTLEGHDAVVLYVAFSPDGTRLASGADTTGRLWDARSGAALGALDGHKGVIWSMSFSADGERIVTGSEDHTCRVWSAETGDELVTLREHTGPVWAAAFSPDGQRVVTGSYDSTMTICNSFTGERYNLLRERASIVNSVAYSHDGEYIASGSADGAVKVWDAPSGAFVAELQAHQDKIKAVTFTPDDNSIISSSDDGTIRVWKLVDILRL